MKYSSRFVDPFLYQRKVIAERPLTLVSEAQPLYYARMYKSVENEKAAHINLLMSALIRVTFELAITLKLSHYSVMTFSTVAVLESTIGAREEYNFWKVLTRNNNEYFPEIEYRTKSDMNSG